MRPGTAIFLGLFIFVGLTATVKADNPAAQRIHKLGHLSTHVRTVKLTPLARQVLHKVLVNLVKVLATPTLSHLVLYGLLNLLVLTRRLLARLANCTTLADFIRYGLFNLLVLTRRLLAGLTNCTSLIYFFDVFFLAFFL